jgi:hypothetical protein
MKLFHSTLNLNADINLSKIRSTIASQFISTIEAYCFVLLLRFRTMNQANFALQLQNVYRVLGHPCSTLLYR